VDRVPEQGPLARPTEAGGDDVAKPRGRRVGQQPIGEREDVEADDGEPAVAAVTTLHLGQTLLEGVVEQPGEPPRPRPNRGALLPNRGCQADVGQVRYQHVPRPRGGEIGDEGGQRGRGSDRYRVRVGRPGGCQQVVAPAVDHVESARAVRSPAPSGKVRADLVAQVGRAALGPGSPDRVVGAAGRGRAQLQPEPGGEVLDPNRPVGEAAGVAVVGQAVAEHDELGDRGLGFGRPHRQGETRGQGDSGTDAPRNTGAQDERRRVRRAAYSSSLADSAPTQGKRSRSAPS